jgi:hypothetical protein
MKKWRFLLSYGVFIYSLISGATDFKLMGSYLLEYSIFKIDIYVISYFKSSNQEKLVLDYKTAVKKKYSIEGWKVGLKHKLTDASINEKAQWLYDHSVDVEKGDKLIILKTTDYLEIYKNEELIGKTSDKMIMGLAFEPWLGEKPVKEELKGSLLKSME